MKIIATSDWHLGNLFHGNDRLQEHNHFFRWLLNCVIEEQPDVVVEAHEGGGGGHVEVEEAQELYKLLYKILGR